MASQHIQEEFSQGEDVDFDQLNENRLRSNLPHDDIDKLLNVLFISDIFPLIFLY